MAKHQSGITAEASSAAIFLTYNVVPEHEQQVATVLAECPALQDEFNDTHAGADLHLTVAIGSQAWERFSPASRPQLLTPFPAQESSVGAAPSTPVDLMFHIRSARKDLNFELARLLAGKLDGFAELVEEVEGFRYLDSRDLTGFVDGTENPQGDNRIQVAVVGDEDPAYVGGSYIHLQRYVHNLTYWNKQSVTEQEDAVGRTKTDNVEFPSAEKSPCAHTKRTSLKDSEGRSIEILRHSMPYGNSQECGLLFASYCRTPENFTLMLESMVQGDADGHKDKLLKYTRAVTGQAFFAPSLETLSQLATG